ncbi:UNVERIFIED_CONTAM: hypothetical protein H355_017015 [Colinus virginianus]|nr:hypothetical protein H355_017015 [Colinus virginianus]
MASVGKGLEEEEEFLGDTVGSPSQPLSTMSHCQVLAQGWDTSPSRTVGAAVAEHPFEPKPNTFWDCHPSVLLPQHRAQPSRRTTAPFLMNNAEETTQPRCIGTAVHPLTPLSPRSPPGSRKPFSYDRWDEELDTMESTERSSHSPTSDGETESRAAETPA